MMTRRQSLSTLAGLGLLPFVDSMAFAQSPAPLLTRPIPSTGEKLPVIGVGTWQTFDVGVSPDERKPLTDVLTTMVANGATVIDSSPMYGRSEQVAGELSTAANINNKLFIATKVWTSGEEAGIRQMNTSMSLLKRQKLDLLQIHNLVDWKTHLRTLLKWKESGRIRYIGITHYIDSMHQTMADILLNNPIDFIQVNYNLLDTNADRVLLPAAMEKKVAVIINRPFEEGALFSRVKGKTLPSFAAEIDCTSWAQFFLKFIVSHPAVTCAIPGTSKVSHLLDNLGAATGRMPDESMRKRMLESMA
jgi:diketogulonate reductase-like aldo/keto reductase